MDSRDNNNPDRRQITYLLTSAGTRLQINPSSRPALYLHGHRSVGTQGVPSTRGDGSGFTQRDEKPMSPNVAYTPPQRRETRALNGIARDVKKTCKLFQTFANAAQARKDTARCATLIDILRAAREPILYASNH